MRRLLKVVLWLVVAGVVVFAAIQFVPYGRAHENPPVTAEPTGTARAPRSWCARACYDCHSNEMVWPWYSNVAPASWLVTHDVEEARAALNFSEWDALPRRPAVVAVEIEEVVRDGEMPPLQYRVACTLAPVSPMRSGRS